MRLTVRLLLLLMIISFTTLLGGFIYLRRSLPKTQGTVHLTGLDRPVEVLLGMRHWDLGGERYKILTDYSDPGIDALALRLREYRVTVAEFARPHDRVTAQYLALDSHEQELERWRESPYFTAAADADR